MSNQTPQINSQISLSSRLSGSSTKASKAYIALEFHLALLV